MSEDFLGFKDSMQADNQTQKELLEFEKILKEKYGVEIVCILARVIKDGMPTRKGSIAIINGPSYNRAVNRFIVAALARGGIIHRQ